MKLTTRAGGFAAAILLTVSGMVHPTPSRAWEMNAPPVTSTMIAAPPTQDLPVPPPSPAPAPAAASAESPTPDPSLPEPHRSLAQMVAGLADGGTIDAEHECLASAVYFESKGEPLRGQLSVAQVILNRAHSGRFPASLCGVVKQRGQFSFVHAGRLPTVPRASSAWRKAVAIARIAREDLVEGDAGRALFFHARRVAPDWHGMIRTASIGNHVFYR